MAVTATSRQPWWSDALNDPWRDPQSPAVIVTTAPTPEPPPPAPVEPARPLAATSRSLVVVGLVAGLFAGALGGALGYVAATAQQTPVVIGASGQAPPALRVPGSIAALVPEVMPSVVTVNARSGLGGALGSGFVISSRGFLITNDHVVSEATSVAVTFSDGTTATAQVVGSDTESDVAVLHVDRPGLTSVWLADSDKVAVGDGVFAVGSPLALSGTVTAGIVSALDRTIEAQDIGGVDRYYAAIQTDAAVNRGSSGGPLFDLAGRVIGINSVIRSVVADGQAAGNIGIAFAIPINQAIRIASEIIDTGRARRTVVGAAVNEYDGPGGGVRITSIDDGGPAAEAGLRTGDVVVRIGEHQVEQPHDLIAMVRRYAPGTTVTLVYKRGGATQVASVVLVADVN